MKTIDIKANLLSAGVDLDELRPDNVEKASQFVSYHYGDSNGGIAVINIESTARVVMAEMLCLPVDVQERAFYLVAMLVKNPGDQAILSGDGKRRGARIVRLASDDESVHNFLLTH